MYFFLKQVAKQVLVQRGVPWYQNGAVLVLHAEPDRGGALLQGAQKRERQDAH